MLNSRNPWISGFCRSSGPLAICSSPERTCSIMLTNCTGERELEAIRLSYQPQPKYLHGSLASLESMTRSAPAKGDVFSSVFKLVIKKCHPLLSCDMVGKVIFPKLFFTSPTSPFPRLTPTSRYFQLLTQLNNHFYNTGPILGHL